MIWPPPRSTRTYSLVPYTTLFRSLGSSLEFRVCLAALNACKRLLRRFLHRDETKAHVVRRPLTRGIRESRMQALLHLGDHCRALVLRHDREKRLRERRQPATDVTRQQRRPREAFDADDVEAGRLQTATVIGERREKPRIGACGIVAAARQHVVDLAADRRDVAGADRKSTRLNSSH